MKWQYKEEKPYGEFRIPFVMSLLHFFSCPPFSAEVRATESAKIREKHPDRVPVSWLLCSNLNYIR